MRIARSVQQPGWVAAALMLALAAGGAGGCAHSPDVDQPDNGPDAGATFADVVLSFSQGGQPQVCSDGLPPCDGQPVPACGPSQVLGAPDGTSYPLEAGGNIELGFHCAPAVERGGTDSPDVKIWADVPEGASAVVEVSDDGSNYVTWVELTQSDQELDLQTIDRELVRFLRISDRGGGGISIDAVEALR